VILDQQDQLGLQDLRVILVQLDHRVFKVFKVYKATKDRPGLQALRGQRAQRALPVTPDQPDQPVTPDQPDQPVTPDQLGLQDLRVILVQLDQKVFRAYRVYKAYRARQDQSDLRETRDLPVQQVLLATQGLKEMLAPLAPLVLKEIPASLDHRVLQVQLALLVLQVPKVHLVEHPLTTTT